MNKKILKILRWLAILPVAIILTYLTLTIFDVIGKTVSPSKYFSEYYDSKPFLYFWSPLATILCSFVVIVVCSIIAPSNKDGVILSIGTLFVFIGIALAFGTIQSSTDGDRLTRLYGDLGYIPGTIIALFKYRNLFFKKVA